MDVDDSNNNFLEMSVFEKWPCMNICSANFEVIYNKWIVKLYKSKLIVYIKTETVTVNHNNKCIKSLFLWFTKDNIKDKMRSIPIEVSADISTKQEESINGLPRMIPILDATQPSKIISEVKATSKCKH